MRNLREKRVRRNEGVVNADVIRDHVEKELRMNGPQTISDLMKNIIKDVRTALRKPKFNIRREFFIASLFVAPYKFIINGNKVLLRGESVAPKDRRKRRTKVPV